MRCLIAPLMMVWSRSSVLTSDNWSFPFVDAPAKDALIKHSALVGSSAEISKWIILGIVSQLKLISNFINV
jgi:hypothetical protein